MVEAGAVMLVGGVVSVAFAVTIIPPDALPGWVSLALPRQSPSWSGLLLLVAVLIATTPYIAVPANWFLQEFSRMIEQRARKKEASNSSTARTTDLSNEPINVPTDSVVPRLTWQFLTTASLMFALSWAGHGLSLLLVLRSLNPQMLSLDNWTIATAAAAAGTSIGFFAIFAPGGLAVREGLIITVLAPSTGGAIAVAAAGLYRLASLTAECLAAFTLYVVAPRTDNPSSSNKQV